MTCFTLSRGIQAHSLSIGICSGHDCSLALEFPPARCICGRIEVTVQSRARRKSIRFEAIVTQASAPPERNTIASWAASSAQSGSRLSALALSPHQKPSCRRNFRRNLRPCRRISAFRDCSRSFARPPIWIARTSLVPWRTCRKPPGCSKMALHLATGHNS